MQPTSNRTIFRARAVFYSPAGLLGALFVLLLFSGVEERATAQTFVASPRIRMLQNSLRTAAQQHASPEQMGKLWHSLGVQYQNGFDYENAEDAYARAIHLLRNTALKEEYADSLHSIADIYLMQGRLKEGRNNDAEALAIFEELGQTRNAALVRCTTAMRLLREHKFAEAEAQASAALTGLESLGARSEVESAYLTRARAIAGEGRPAAALEDVGRARAMATKDLNSNSIDAVAILLVQGEIQMQGGMDAEGEQSLAEALKRARSMTGLPPATQASLEASILDREATSLRKAHHNDEAKVLEAQMKRAIATASSACNGCTVNVASLLPQ